jgi:hypothetical protein
MREDASLEHLLERVTLVRGAGDRGDGRLCVMSLAALIAGERHTDAPHAVSPLIRRFAIAINDGLPDADRQRLKLFAPRMVGTNDAHDKDRARLILSILTSEIVPALKAEDADHWATASGDTHDPSAALDDLIGRTLQQARKAVVGKHVGEIADCASSLLTTCAKSAPSTAIRARCWSRSIDLLDRICSVGDENRPSLAPEQFAAAHRTLDKRGVFQRIDAFHRALNESRAAKRVDALLERCGRSIEARIRLFSRKLRRPGAKPTTSPNRARSIPVTASRQSADIHA